MSLFNDTLYSIFIRNFGGSFRAVSEQIPRLHDLGIDVIWLMPIHPIGSEKRKGTLGSPYAISDYRSVNPEFGSMQDFVSLCDIIHASGMKVIIDVVYNHTSPDSLLAKTHPEWFYHKPDGRFMNRIGDWSDIVDLDYRKKELWDYQIDTLKFWAGFVDGFRCDVAPLVPLGFWQRARREVETVRKGCLWIAESVDPGFIQWCREHNIPCLSDSELYDVFDVCYDYDVYSDFLNYAEGKTALSDYLLALRRQDGLYRPDSVKLRFTENHDRPRTASLFPSAGERENWLAWLFFQKGLTMLYCGQEWAAAHRPSLFDPDPFLPDGVPMHGQMIQKLAVMKKDPLFSGGTCTFDPFPDDVIRAVWVLGGRKACGVFSMKCNPVRIPVPLADGSYHEYLSGRTVRVRGGFVRTDGKPLILFQEERTA